MKKFLLGIAVAALLGGAVFAQTGGLGAIHTSPVVVGGFFPYNGGPQSSVVAANGGTFTANSTTAVTVTNANITANSVILFGMNTAAGTPAAAPYVTTVTPGTGFTVKAGSGDTSVYNYIILG